MPFDDAPPTKLIAIVALPHFTLLALGCIIDAFRLANRVAGAPIYRWLVIGFDKKVVASSMLSVDADLALAHDHDVEADIVVLCGGVDGYLQQNERQLRTWLRDTDRRGAIIAAVSTGVWPMARAGLLDGRRCAVHWDEIPTFSANFPLADVQRDIFVQDGRRLTCSGGVAILDMILHIITMHHSVTFADDVADLLIHARVRTANEKQRKSERVEVSVLGSVRRAIRLMETNIEIVLTIDDIAKRIGRSPRQLERLFAKTFRTPPKRYYDLVRLRQACRFLTDTDIPVTEVAIRCGYVSQPQFSQQFKKTFKKSPLQYRQKARD